MSTLEPEAKSFSLQCLSSALSTELNIMSAGKEMDILNPFSQNVQKVNLEMRASKSMTGTGMKWFTELFGDLKKETVG